MSTEQQSGDESDPRRVRRRVSLRGYIVREGGIAEPIELLDLNYGGCGIETSVELIPGEIIKLSVHDRGSMPAEVRWCKGGRAGLDFAPSIDSTRKQVERRAARVKVTADVGLRALGRNSYRVRIVDLSTDGCQVELVELPKVGDRMSVKFDGLEVLEADIMWVEGHRAGLTFVNRLHPAVLDLLLRKFGASDRG